MSPPLISKAAARYTGAGGKEHCSLCRHFSPRRGGRCARVLGDISPMGWCRLFSREMRGLVADASSFNGGGGPALGLDFMVPGVLDPRLVFTRASTGTYFNSAGVMQTAAVNTPRWDYDPATLQLRGLLLEEARTNVLLNSATLSTQSVAVTAQAYRLSFYGTGTITKSGAATGALAGTGVGQRVSQTFTPAAGSLTLTVAGTVSNAQLEAGGFATSYIPTTSVAVTRAADSCTIPIGSWFNPSAFSLAIEHYWTNVTTTPLIGVSDNAFAENTCYLSELYMNKIGTGQGLAVSNMNNTIGAVNKQCGTFSTTQLKSVTNGNLSGVVPWNATMVAPSGALRLAIGEAPWGPGSGAFNGHARVARVWPRVLTDAEMQTVTTL